MILNQKENKNILVECINNKESIKNYLKNFFIDILYTIDEYYFGKENEGGIKEDYVYNSTEFRDKYLVKSIT